LFGSAVCVTVRSSSHTRWREPSPPAFATSMSSSSLRVHEMRFDVIDESVFSRTLYCLLSVSSAWK
jgi:hypothetical protein